MPEPRSFVFSHRELTETLVKQQNIRKGLWGIHVRFGLSAGNTSGIYEGVEQLVPTAIVPVLEIGIREYDEPNSFTVDASKLRTAGRKKVMAKKKPTKKKSVAKKGAVKKNRAAMKKSKG